MTEAVALLLPRHICSSEEIFTTEVVPKAAGVYAWWFRDVPPGVPTDGCIVHHGLTLLYVGIAPKAPPANGARSSGHTLRHRIRYHMNGNGEGSTLRLTLGCLLSEQLGLELRRMGSGRRMTFGNGEAKLSEWMARNAFVSWVVTDKPWELEASVIGSVCLPLNLAQNQRHPFHAQLSACRAAAKQRARELPIHLQP